MNIRSAILRAERTVDELMSSVDDGIVAYRKAASQYPTDPVGYIRNVLRSYVTPQQAAICEALIKPPYRVLVPSANNVGKTYICAAIVSWFFDNYDPSITLATAPVKTQVRDLLFKEIRVQRGRIGANFGFQPRETRLETSWDHFVHGFTAATADSFQGRHDSNMGVVFDEASGVHGDFWERGETMFGGDVGNGNLHWWLCPFNPYDVSSPAYAAEDTGLWAVVQLSALDHPNIAAELAGRTPPVPSAIRLKRLLDRINTECDRIPDDHADPAQGDFQFPHPVDGMSWYRPNRPAFEAGVLGRWPLIATSSLIAPSSVDQCRANSTPLNDELTLKIGCDVARFGDDETTIAARRGASFVHLEGMAKRNTPEIARRIAEVAGMYARAEDARETVIAVDGTGGYGGGVVDHLNMLGFYRVQEVCMASASPNPTQLRMRTYLWSQLADMLVARLLDFSRLPELEYKALRADLVAPRYTNDAQNRRVLEPKQQTKRRLRRSPDRGDAITLAI